MNAEEQTEALKFPNFSFLVPRANFVLIFL